MKTTNEKRVSFAPIALSFLAALVLVATVQAARADDLGETAVKPVRGTCTFSLQLQKSVAARRDYLVKLDQARGVSQTAKNSVEEMYTNVQPASYGGQWGAWTAVAAGPGLQ
jgi:hypothetical protein